tara:strand:- start:465 stop:818 length:354 start_codon:yes stop_codon:yes gene_type:complete
MAKVKKKAGGRGRQSAQKKAASKKKQRTFEGKDWPKKPPKSVSNALDEYLTAKREAADAAEMKSSAHEKLIEICNKHKITRLRIEGENKFLEIGENQTAKIKTIPKDERDAREGRER